MVFCRGCGKQIHETAPSCPSCGALQNLAPTPTHSQSYHWTHIVSLVTAVLFFLLLAAEPDQQWSQDECIGLIVLSLIPIGFGIAGVTSRPHGRWMSITGMIIGAVLLLAAIGNMN